MMTLQTPARAGRSIALACAALVLTSPAPSAAQSGPPTLSELVEARTIDSLTLSPDGRSLAFRVLSPSLAQDETRLQWRSVNLVGPARDRPLGPSGAPKWLPLFDVPEDGLAEWAPDSGSLFVQWVEPDAVQVRRIGANGMIRAVTNDAADIVAFSLSEDGRRLRYTTRAARAEIARLQQQERQRGVLVDETVVTTGMAITDNFEIGQRSTTIRWLNGEVIEAQRGALQQREIASGWRGHVRPLSPARRDFITALPVFRADTGARDDAGARQVLQFAGSEVRVVLEQAGEPGGLGLLPYQVTAILEDGSRLPCPESFCRGERMLRQVMLNDATGEVVVLRHHANQSSLHGWNPRTGRSRLIYAPAGTLNGGSPWSASLACPVLGGALFCVESGPTQPQSLVRIDMTSGGVDTLANPNALLAQRQFAETRFITWRDPQGRLGQGVLMLPAGAQRNLPLVITSYTCSGFLTGGWSNLASEHLLAQAGFAVLCLSAPEDSVYFERDGDGKPIPAVALRAFLSLTQAIVDQLAGEGLIDPRRVGAAGHSYSAIFISYAIAHSDVFAAVNIHGTTLDRSTYFLHHAIAAHWGGMSIPLPHEPNFEAVIEEVSPSINVRHIRAPVLMQAPGVEWLFGLELYRTLRDSGRASELYVFPDAGHVMGRSPLHELHRNERSLDWFIFWLQNSTSDDPAKSEMFERWRALRAEHCAALAGAGAPAFCRAW